MHQNSPGIQRAAAAQTVRCGTLDPVSVLNGVIPGIVDAHAHFFHPVTLPPARRRLPGTDSLLRRLPPPALHLISGLTEHRDFHMGADFATRTRSFQAADYGRAAAGLGSIAGVPVRSVIAMDSRWRRRSSADDFLATTQRELAFLRTQPFGTGGLPELAGAVVCADARVPGLGVTGLFDDDEAGLIRGVRLCLGSHVDPMLKDWYFQPGLLESGTFKRAAPRLADRGLVFEVLCYSHELARVDALAREFPDTTVIAEHLGLPVGVFGPVGSATGATAAARADILSLWRERTAMLATRPNVLIKISAIAGAYLGYGSEKAGNIGGQRILADMIGPMVLHLVEHFGPSRVIFGSNVPLDDPNASLGVIVGALLDVLGDRGERALAMFFAENAQRAYRLAADRDSIS